ncbi:MAG: hypothetical protein J7641_15610 [Cyanobacteria bacterium SID2]|nr:hypothetical protein [Cyanobacteria bacterium SID2]MBP0003306.1 hypothetical protein [Cyanobacteria bacterium SBC]
MESNLPESQAQYEFDNSQNELVGDLSKKMSFVATLLIVFGILSLLNGVIVLVSSFSATEAANSSISEVFSAIVNGIFMVVVGLWTRNAANAFQNIVKTEGRDIENLMVALGELRKLYALP